MVTGWEDRQDGWRLPAAVAGEPVWLPIIANKRRTAEGIGAITGFLNDEARLMAA
jgi:hypothetical protein